MELVSCQSELTVHCGWELKPWGLNVSSFLKAFQQGVCLRRLAWWVGLFLRKDSCKLLHAEDGLRSKLYSGSLLVSELLTSPPVRREVEFKITCLCCLPCIFYFTCSLMGSWPWKARSIQQGNQQSTSHLSVHTLLQRRLKQCVNRVIALCSL